MTGSDVEGWAPEACTLPTVERPFREQEFHRFFRDHLRSVRRLKGTIAELELAPESAGLAQDLARRETGCCSFFGFDVRDDDVRVVMTIEVPPLNVPVLDALIASASAAAAVTPVEARAAARPAVPPRQAGVRP